MKILIVVASLSNLHLLASLLKQCIYAAKDSFSFCWISIKWLMDMWMSELQVFRWKASLMSSQVLFIVKVSDINVLTSPLDFACANLVLLSPVNSEAV